MDEIGVWGKNVFVRMEIFGKGDAGYRGEIGVGVEPANIEPDAVDRVAGDADDVPNPANGFVVGGITNKNAGKEDELERRVRKRCGTDESWTLMRIPGTNKE